MIEFPYGIADFHMIRTQGMCYVDRTAHVRDAERLGRTLVFLRPRRFDKGCNRSDAAVRSQCGIQNLTRLSLLQNS